MEPDLHSWAVGERRNVLDLADVLGVSPEVYLAEPASLVPAPQDYVSRAPLEEFEQADWITLHADLMSYVADYAIRKHGARWNVADDPTAPRGYRYVVEAIGRDGQTRQLGPLRAVAREIVDLPIEITRMLAGAELTLGLASGVLPATHSPTGPTTTR
ncbi:hypothetical protein D0Z67_20315 [Streptomyces seoulensis]|uniref:Uncharacterized protein n=1 Tax=Streptomyces seoulensis TaxID=73044 RepID=A0A4P6TXM9_STRSO|nr:hypothetical protein D0Z67_20315 [Streptomyces seoulensis]